MLFPFPRIYPILDSSYIPASGRREFLSDLGASLADAGVTLLEYRNKTGSAAEVRAGGGVCGGLRRGGLWVRGELWGPLPEAMRCCREFWMSLRTTLRLGRFSEPRPS